MSRNVHDEDEYEQEEQSTAHQIEEIYEGRPDVSEMSYEELEREIKYEEAMDEAYLAQFNIQKDDDAVYYNYNAAVKNAEAIGKEDGRQVQDELGIRHQATKEEREPINARQDDIRGELLRRDNQKMRDEISAELERRENLKTPSHEPAKEAHKAIGELDERGKDAKTSTQELAREAREATREVNERAKNKDEHER
jgi:hypothetical protein